MIYKTRQIKDKNKMMGVLPTIKVEVPKYLLIATDNARCPNAEVFIKEGDEVKLGQVIGVRHAPYFDQPIHSTCSGKMIGYEKHYHRSGKIVNFIKLENDFKDTLDEHIQDRSDEEIYRLSRGDMAEILKENSVVGLGGSSFPTYVKFQTDKKINTILINGIECEPYLSSDHRLLLEQAEDMIKGISYIQQAFDCKDARICVKSKYKDIINVYKQILSWYPESGISICPVGNYYPQGWEVEMIKSALGIKVEQGKLPSDYGVINFNVSTCLGIYLAIKKRMPVYERYMSVFGDGVSHPANFVVRVGTPIAKLIERCGGYVGDGPKTIILGGPMMGACLPSDDCVATKTVTSAIILNRKKEDESPCIRCGSCVYSCPVGLEPIQIKDAMKIMPADKEMVKSLNPLKCIQCGLCTYSCPSKIHLLDIIKRAKIVARLP